MVYSMKFFISADRQCVTVENPAKINLFLKVCHRRSDGYHEIETLMQKIDLVDRVRLEAGGDTIRLACPGSDLPEDEGNLAFRAARLLLAKGGVESGVDIVLEKRIPVAAGLGGGSSDAAAVLSGVNLLFDLGLDQGELLGLGRQLGADVPFFVTGYRAAWATGIGDRLTEAAPLDDGCLLVLVNPGFHVSTRWVYESFALTTGDNPYILARDWSGPQQQNGVEKNPRQSANSLELFNDLEAVTVNKFPEIGDIKCELLATGAEKVLMSGSGPTVFGIFGSTGEDAWKRARLSCNKLAKKYGRGVFLTRPYRS